MYNALASSEKPGSMGSTRLHMDMADAVNIMTFACKTPAGADGYAAWDIFKADDADKLRKFLRDKFTVPPQHDPIHSQQYYLDSTLRRQLYEKYGVMSHRIYQQPGQAVFIPAGCAHQVRHPLAPPVCRATSDLVSWVIGCQPRRLRQGCDRLREPRECRAMRAPDARVPGTEPVTCLEGGRSPAPHDDVVRLALV